jgi:2-deoxy-D-gluconate 3-dehydrogenase
MILDRFKLDGKTALVTGCKKGMGRAYTRALAEAGANIIGVDMDAEMSGIEADVVKTGKKLQPAKAEWVN